MSVPAYIVMTAFVCGAIGIIGGMAMVWLIDRSESYIDEHPPDAHEHKLKKGDEHDEH